MKIRKSCGNPMEIPWKSTILDQPKALIHIQRGHHLPKLPIFQLVDPQPGQLGP